MKKETTFGWRQACGYIAEHIEVQEYNPRCDYYIDCVNENFDSVDLGKKSTYRLKPTAPEPVRVPVRGDVIEVCDMSNKWLRRTFLFEYRDAVYCEPGDGPVLGAVPWSKWRWPMEEKAEEMVSVKKGDLDNLRMVRDCLCKYHEDEYPLQSLSIAVDKLNPLSDNK